MRDLVAALRERGLVHQVTDEVLGPLSARSRIVAYIGFDPSAPSLHAGSLYPVMLLAHLARAGHAAIALLGGGTGRIGDPSGKQSERPLLDAATIERNVRAQRAQIERVFRNAGAPVAVLDNAAWLHDLRLVDFLRDTGKHFTVNWMMAKDSVRARLEDREQGISFTEFSYMLLQAYDYLRLYEDRGCCLQMGGSDQWGNITAGIELIRRVRGDQAFGLTSPLLLDAAGRKFGKSERGAVWLDATATSPYRFFQFWLNQDDARASALLAAYTMLPMDEVNSVRASAAADPEKRIAQRALAKAVTSLVHGADAASRAEAAGRVLFGEGSVRDLDAATIEDVFGEVPSATLPRKALQPPGARMGEVFVRATLVKSATDFARQAAQGAIYVNGERVPASKKGEHPSLSPADLLHDRFIVLRRGKKDYALLRVVEG